MPQSLSLSPSRAHSPHLGHHTLWGTGGKLIHHGVPSYKNIMGMETGEQKVGSLAGLRHPPIYKEGN